VLQTPSTYDGILVVKESCALVKDLLSQTHESLAIIWSAIDSYELLNIQGDSERISELGIKL